MWLSICARVCERFSEKAIKMSSKLHTRHADPVVQVLSLIASDTHHHHHGGVVVVVLVIVVEVTVGAKGQSLPSYRLSLTRSSLLRYCSWSSSQTSRYDGSRSGSHSFTYFRRKAKRHARGHADSGRKLAFTQRKKQTGRRPPNLDQLESRRVLRIIKEKTCIATVTNKARDV